MAETTLNKQLRTLICCGRSGSTPILHCLAQSEAIDARYQSIKTSVRDALRANIITGKASDSYNEDYSIFYEKTPDGITTILKEAIGSSTIAECDYAVFPNSEKNAAIKNTKPIFLLRDPLEFVDAKERRGWKSVLENSARAYTNVYREFLYASSVDKDAVLPCTYDHLMSKPEAVIRQICSFWKIQYEDVMLNWKYPFPGRIKGGKDFDELRATGAFDGISNSTTLKKKEYRGLILGLPSILRMTRGDLSDMYDAYEDMKEKADKVWGKV